MLYVIQQKQVHRVYNEVIHVINDDVNEMVFQLMIHHLNITNQMQIYKLKNRNQKSFFRCFKLNKP